MVAVPTRQAYDELKRAYEAQRLQLAAMTEHNAALTREVGRLAEIVAKSNDRIAELLAIAQRKKSSAKPSANKAPKPPPSLDEDARKAFAERPAPPKLPKKKKRKKKKSKPTGRKPLPDHLEAEEHTVKPERCECGCEDLEIVDAVTEVKLHAVQAHIRKRVVKRLTARIKKASKMNLPVLQSRVGKTLAYIEG